MYKFIATFFLSVCVYSLSAQEVIQTSATNFAVILQPIGKYKSANGWTPTSEKIARDQQQFIDSLAKKGVVQLSGNTPLKTGDEQWQWMVFFYAKDQKAATALWELSPAVDAGIYGIKLYPFVWHEQKK